MRRLLLLASFSAVALLLVPLAAGGPVGAQREAVLYPSSPWSGVISIDYHPNPALESQYALAGTVETVMRLTKAGAVNGRDGSYSQQGHWESTLSLSKDDGCQIFSVFGTYAGEGRIISWQYRGQNTFYLGMGPSPQPDFQADYSKSENRCETGDPDRGGKMYWNLAVGDEAEWYHHACSTAHTLTGVVNPGIQDGPSKTTVVRYQLTQLPDQNGDGVPDGGTATTGSCSTNKPPPPPPPPNCGSSTFKGCPPPDPYKLGYVDSYSMAGVCGKAHAGKMKGQPRCYILLGQKTILAVKNHELDFLSLASLASGRIAIAMGKKVLISKVRRKLLSVALKKFAGEGVDKANSALSLGKLLAQGFTAAFLAQRWHDLGRPGFPAKCFGFQVTYDGGKPKPTFDAVWSFVRTWDRNDPPSYRGITTSNEHWWDEDKRHSYLLPLFCRGRFAQAVATGSEVPGQLLDPPYIQFNIDYQH
ncbi:MAG: hypothetical protein QOE36_1403 [Gaiellaceae bacterium]|nr:hypothetical protein [Gaiellaceae bacterium]